MYFDLYHELNLNIKIWDMLYHNKLIKTLNKLALEIKTPKLLMSYGSVGPTKEYIDNFFFYSMLIITFLSLYQILV